MVSWKGGAGGCWFFQNTRASCPWTPPATVFRAPVAGQSLFAYAAKGHARLSHPGRLMISYVVNSTDLKELISNAGIYQPEFADISVGSVPE